MENGSQEAATPETLEASIVAATKRVFGNLNEQYRACEESVRKSPASSLVKAAILGYLIRNLPLGIFLSGIIRLALGLVRPVLLLYVAAKGYEHMKRGSGVPVTSGDQPGNVLGVRQPKRAQRGG